MQTNDPNIRPTTAELTDTTSMGIEPGRSKPVSSLNPTLEVVKEREKRRQTKTPTVIKKTNNKEDTLYSAQH